jgi:IMP and pyridine-specific 5'-nucleotidase
MSFSSRRRNYMLSSHRRDGLIEWMKGMLTHSFVLDLLAATAPATFAHFEELVDEHRAYANRGPSRSASLTNLASAAEAPAPAGARRSRLEQIVPSVGTFHTPLPLRRAFLHYDGRYRVTKRRHVTLSFNEIRQVLNLAQVMALCEAPAAAPATPGAPLSVSVPAPAFRGPRLVTFDGDQTLYSDGANFDGNPKLAEALTLLLKNGVAVAVVTAAG